MLRSLFSGISGLSVNQTMLDVTGNNIANANTTGFKASTTVFQDTLSQLLTPATRSNDDRVATNFGQGSAQSTGRATDLMIQGDGFFVLQRGAENQYTRAGAFTFDETGTLVTPAGARVQGFRLDAAGDPIIADPADPAASMVDITLDSASVLPAVPAGVELTSYSFGSDGILRGVYTDGVQRDMARLAVADFNNPMGLEKLGETAFRASANSGGAVIGTPDAGGNGSIIGGALEMSNVDLAAEFTNLILAQRGYQASSRVITTSDTVLDTLVNIKR